MPRKDRSSLRVKSWLSEVRDNLGMKGDWCLALIALSPSRSSMAFFPDYRVRRKPVSKNLKSCFTKALLNTKAQVILRAALTVCHRRKRGEGTSAPWRIWCTLPHPPSGEAASAEPQTALMRIPVRASPERHWCPRKEKHQWPADSAKPTGRVGLRHTWETHPIGPFDRRQWEGIRGLEVLAKLSGGRTSSI